ncbi:morphogenetic stage IV sporulation protein [[Clostridium] ultunense Esp]|uniref:Morphogenetic stage IV sporulation protein n=1 Tax=[Clostridium] ultunense Esp TaxID=1288971 RepID=M1YZJ9_9FIRM|nr:stage IV sporulation protein A [Schnuerera ultunensis]CCQ96025.1 morphogenetic stage IV sporulation protein [[Clostridium] ultunense Esp]SHD76919.1 morphogenetic stage IV sporulation protein [[Clostridium] ultunense Esp]
MERFDIYKDIAERTEGDIYAGVVGPVRTGKSTFIKRFMELLVIPNIENKYKKERAKDELPLSGAGKTIMTTEPKFVPNEAVELILKDNVTFKVRMVDCVGYLVKGALGHIENDVPRMVSTPWYEKDIPFEEAAEIGTRKVTTDHSTIGIVVTTDGSITDIDRSNYIKAEERVIFELKELEKPFVIILNTKHPNLDSTIALRESLEEKYGVSVVTVDCLNMEIQDVEKVFEKLLFEFPVKEITINLPGWIEGLPRNHWIKSSILNSLKESIQTLQKLNEVDSSLRILNELDIVKNINIKEIKLGEGVVNAELIIDEGLFFKVLKEMTGYTIEGDYQVLGLINKLAQTKKEYDKIENALTQANEIGYGLVSPSLEEMELAEPEIYRQGNRFGVKLKAKAPSLHLLRCDITTEVSPLIGTEKQSEELVRYFLDEFEEDPSKIWQSNLFGKSLYDLVNEQLQGKLNSMPDDARNKMRKALERIINDGSGGLICIIV